MIGLGTLIIWAVMGILLIVVLTLWLTYRKNDFKVRVRELTSNETRLIRDTVGRIKKDEEKVEYLRLWGGDKDRRSLPIPSPEAIDFDPTKKKKVVEAWWSAETGYVYVKDGKPIDGFQPLTTKQRAMLVNQIKKKEARKEQTWQQHIPLIVGGMTLVMLLAIFLIFIGDAVQPMHQLADRLDRSIEKNSEILDKAMAYERGEQVIMGDVPNKGGG